MYSCFTVISAVLTFFVHYYWNTDSVLTKMQILLYICHTYETCDVQMKFRLFLFTHYVLQHFTNHINFFFTT